MVAARRDRDDSRPLLAAGPELRTSGRTNSTIPRQPQGVEIPRGNCENPGPVLYVALARGVVAGSADGTVRVNRNRVPITTADIRHLAPVLDPQLLLHGAARRHQ